MELFLRANNNEGLAIGEIKSALLESIKGRELKRVLIVPPDFTRFHSNAGMITSIYYSELTDRGCEVDIIPALGTHEPMTKEQCSEMFLNIPYKKFIHHRWRDDVVRIGKVPGDFLSDITDGIWTEPIVCEINKNIMNKEYDLILSVGQVVPHEVIGMANHSKNIFVGCGGSDMINKSHMVGALYGMERMMGMDHTPVRKMFDYCAENFLSGLPILYVLTVTTAPGGRIQTHGLFIGEGRKTLTEAIALSQSKNIDFVDRGIKKCIVYLDPKEFKSTWIGNKAIYRTRMAIADEGELIMLAPGVSKFGEDEEVDRLIRKYGYCGRLKVLEFFRENEELQMNMGAAAHLIHGSSDGRFAVTYAVKNIDRSQIEEVHFNYADYDKLAAKYDPHTLAYGWNRMPDGEEIYFIPNPALGLWIDKGKFKNKKASRENG
ncbi:MAG: lactate racemase domain-containing protein [Eubacteriales bacterium]|nr:lactate racemase domain-containing protein [Eubacteriales bacterium]